ncbi:hypothetical protein DUNSADRAFT_13296 [Dunaliella salina]|uniref:Glutamate 5-kinase n=1 Tax=Dunaliella salina TaxID=3046 RepID=A0ABQ7G9N6_DUNSA|nr:hypothetical protein DUNSADRAFT_13296 [Dunaliella salina]|eukprot:KAF5831322.1 hypothetical protein DUNSADRAFT_13296 [Dunaliella salina]
MDIKRHSSPGLPPKPHKPSLVPKTTVVLKVGTSSLVRTEQMTVNLSSLARICETVKALHDQGLETHSRCSL